MHVLSNPLNERPCIAFISEEMRQTGKGSGQSPQQQLGSDSISNGCTVNLHRQEQALGINQDVAFAPVDFFFRRRSRAQSHEQEPF